MTVPQGSSGPLFSVPGAALSCERHPTVDPGASQTREQLTALPGLSSTCGGRARP
ncbi:hypothetical protein [Streptomyces sp. NBC_00690]|uniref:hypothetical protein n=1 Tax=Streptomyces sp. NBC_00690 TaxID=2975808 RepID=UPI002E2812C2|nr:hypothetical protein [Streptomyces sp. NBC_00690]